MSTIARSSSLPVGVVRGCTTCEGCQKVIARWRPGGGCRPSLEDAPVFFPLEEEFQDTVKYIASISAEAEQYGICRIVPPHSWRPPCPLKDSEKRRTTKFPTRVQRLDKLQVREAQAKKEEKRRRGGRPSRCRKDVSSDEEGKFGFEPGPQFTLEMFEEYARQFKEDYFGLRDMIEMGGDSMPSSEPSVESIEGEYWRIVEHATEQLEVLYGADIETGVFGSGFPKAKPGTEQSSYESSGWNLNNIARLGGSVLSFEEEEISGVVVPWLYVGMCLSSFCWHVEDHHFYSLNYMHFGSPKVWYGVPGNAAQKLEDAMKKHLPDLFAEQPDLLHKLVTQLSPSVLKADGVPVYRAVQKPGEFIVTFPRAYHAGFNCGFNCAEAVNVAPIDWLPAGQNAVESYKAQKRKSTVSHDKLLLGAARKQVALSHQKSPQLSTDPDSAAWCASFAQHEVLSKVLKFRVDLERARRAKVECFVHTKKMDKSFDATDARECSICHYDLHLSAVGCECARDRYTCLEHAHELCACDKVRKHALYRYEVAQLDALVAALEGSSEAVGNVLQIFTESLSPCKEVKNLNGLTSEQPAVVSSGHTTISPAALAAPLPETAKETQDFTCIPVDSLWNASFKAMTSFLLQDFENYEHHLAWSTVTETECSQGPVKCAELASRSVPNQSKGSQSANGPSSSGGLPIQEKKSMEVIVLSDDEDCSVSETTSKPIQSLAEKCNVKTELGLMKGPLSSQNVEVFSGLASQSMVSHGPSNIPTIIMHEENKGSTLTLQHTRPVHFTPSLYSSCGDAGIKDGSANNLLCLGHLQAPALGHLQTLTLASCIGQGHDDFPQAPVVSQQLGNHIGVPAVGNSSINCLLSYLPLGRPQEIVPKVDLLSTGRFVSGASWCNKDAIFPAGFRSRVLFASLLDPCQMCFYISEVLDFGHAKPYFKVMMEDHPSEAFIHDSINRCWQMVQERINMMIQLQQCLGKVGLPRLRPPEDIRGLELFGFTSPDIIKAVESLDCRHQALEYWIGRTGVVGLFQHQHYSGISNINSATMVERAPPLRFNSATMQNFWR